MASLVDRLMTGSSDHRVRATWRALVPPLLGFGAQLVALLTILLVIRAVVTVDALAASTAVVLEFGLLALVSVLGLLLTVMLARRWDRRSLSGYGVDRSRADWLDGVAGMGIGFLTYAVPTGVFLVAGGATLTETVASPIEGPVAVAIVAIIAIAFLAQVTFEEFAFRSVLLQNAAEGFTARGQSSRRALLVALVVSAVIFGAMHAVRSTGGGTAGRSLEVILTSALMGLLWGGAFVLTGRLSMAVGLHLGHNLWAAVIVRPEAAVLATPALATVSYTTGDLLVTVAKLAVGIVCVLGWVALLEGELSVAEWLSRPG